jgi:C4-dicarboxylate-specific signal transduction histidine kinase
MPWFMLILRDTYMGQGEGTVLMAEMELPPDAPSRLARLLRHEIGDLLQVVYSTTAVLTARLTGAEHELERTLIADLKRRAEQLKSEVDAVVRLVTPVSPDRRPIDLAGHAEAAVTRLRRHAPQLPVSFSGDGPAAVWADPATLPASLLLLLLALSHRARAVDVSVRAGDPVCCRVAREGPAPTADQLAWMQRPFASTHESHLGVALASCAQAVTSVGGKIEARQEGICFVVDLSFPPVGSSVVSTLESVAPPGV